MLGRVVRAGFVAFVALGCASSYVEVRPSEPLAVTAGHVRAEISRAWLTADVRERGLDDDIDLVVELRVSNDDTRERTLSVGSMSCWLQLDPRHPDETRSLVTGGGGAGPFPGELPEEGSRLAGVPIPAGETRVLWAIFHGYRFEGSDRPRKVTLKVPVDDGELALDLADPAHGELRWQVPPARGATTLGLRSVSLVGGGLRATVPSTEFLYSSRLGPVAWDVGLVSTVLVQSQGPLVSATSSFTGSGLTAHLAVPFASWGPPADRRQLSLFAGGSSSFLVELLTPAAARANQMKRLGPHAYGFLTAEAGLKLDFGALRFAESPFPLTPTRHPLPSWSLLLGYVQGWSGGATGGGFLTSARFNF